MQVEIFSGELEFIADLLKKTHVEYIIKKMIKSSKVHPDNEDYFLCTTTVSELEELVGELSYEANHHRKKSVAEQACEIADSLELSLWEEKHG